MSQVLKNRVSDAQAGKLPLAGSFCPKWRLRLVWMFALPGDLLFHQLHRVGIWMALDVQPIPHHLDH